MTALFWGTVCPFKAITGLPCPGCGGLRALESLIHGRLWEALATNPLSVLLIGFVGVSGVWLVVDIVLGRRSWLDFVTRKWSGSATVIAIALLLLNWAWNICKGL